MLAKFGLILAPKFNQNQKTFVKFTENSAICQPIETWLHLLKEIPSWQRPLIGNSNVKFYQIFINIKLSEIVTLWGVTTLYDKTSFTVFWYWNVFIMKYINGQIEETV